MVVLARTFGVNSSLLQEKSELFMKSSNNSCNPPRTHTRTDRSNHFECFYYYSPPNKNFNEKSCFENQLRAVPLVLWLPNPVWLKPAVTLPTSNGVPRVAFKQFRCRVALLVNARWRNSLVFGGGGRGRLS